MFSSFALRSGHPVSQTAGTNVVYWSGSPRQRNGLVAMYPSEPRQRRPQESRRAQQVLFNRSVTPASGLCKRRTTRTLVCDYPYSIRGRSSQDIRVCRALAGLLGVAALLPKPLGYGSTRWPERKNLRRKKWLSSRVFLYTLMGWRASGSFQIAEISSGTSCGTEDVW